MIRKLTLGIGLAAWTLAGASAYACQGKTVLFEDNFETLEPTWGAKDDAFYLEDGRLVLKPGLDEYYSALNTAGFYDNIDYCVRIYSVNADPAGNSFAGVMFWATDYDNYYYALIAGDGAVGIFRRQRGKTLKQTDWTVFDAANKGKEAVNELRVVTIGKEASVYVNGKLFKTMKGQPPENGQEIGVRATSSKGEKAIYAFDDIKVTEPDTAKSN
jgi:hypothetical protein